MMKKFWLALSGISLYCTTVLGAATAQTQTAAFLHRISPDGTYKIEGQEFAFQVASDNWKWNLRNADTMIPDAGYPKKEANSWEWKGVWKLYAGVEVRFSEKITLETPRRTVLEFEISSSKPFYADFAGVCSRLSIAEFAGRSVSVDGRKIEFPMFPGKEGLGNGDSFDSFELAFRDFKNHLKLTSSGSYNVIDTRRWMPFFEVRFGATPKSGPMRSARQRFVVEDISPDTEPLDLRSIMNRGFADEIDGDGKGGWTDQGAQNDLRMMVPGQYRWGGIRFDIVDPASNGGNSAVVFHSGRVEKRQVNIGGKSFRYLCLQHATTQAAAGTQIGEVHVTYADGDKENIPMQSGVHLGNWWGAVSLQNAPVLWQGKTERGDLRGLYTGIIPVRNKPIREITFINSDKNGKPHDWMIVALSGSHSKIPDLNPEAHYITAGEKWRPIPNSRDIEPGSVLDLSFLNDAPAGKYGKVVIRNGRYEFEKRPGKAVRFNGANVCFTAAFPDHAEAERMAKHFAMLGYNAIRFHHQDFYMEPRHTTELDPEAMDKLDYFFSCLKKEGIYVTTDLHAHRFTENKIPGLPGWYYIGAYRALALKHEGAGRDWERFARNFLTHVNPYTKTAYKDDPALISLCLLNEGNLDYWIDHSEYHMVPRFYGEEFEKWLAARGKQGVSEEEKQALRKDFFFEVERDAYREKSAFLRKLGVQQLLTNLNMKSSPRLSLLRDGFDFVDNHGYWDHPTNQNLPSTYTNKSSLDGMVPKVFAGWFPSRILGKPFTITEYNWCYPNRYRAEGGVLIGAYSALQGYDGIYRFAYAHDKKLYEDGDYEIRAFDVANDVISLHGDRIAALLFRRGDVAESKLLLPVRIPRSEIRNDGEWPKMVQCLGLVGKTGSVVEQADGSFRPQVPLAVTLPGDQAPGGVPADQVVNDLARFGEIGKARLDVAGKSSRSSTGEIELDGLARTLKVTTPFSEALVINSQGKLDGEIMSVETSGPATFFAASMDGSHSKLAEAERIVLFHLTDMLNSNTHFMNRAENVMDQYGSSPRLVRVGKALIQLRLNVEGTTIPKVYPLHLDGKRQTAIDSVFLNGTLRFQVDTGAGEEPALAYEIVME